MSVVTKQVAHADLRSVTLRSQWRSFGNCREPYLELRVARIGDNKLNTTFVTVSEVFGKGVRNWLVCSRIAYFDRVRI